MHRSAWRHYPLVIGGLSAMVGCSSLLGLGPYEKVDCVESCAEPSAGAAGAGNGIAGASSGASGSPDAAGSDNGGSGGSGGAEVDPALYLIDDFSDCNGDIIEFDGRQGAWFNFSSLPQYATLTFGPPPSTGWTDKSCGAFLTGMCQTCGVIGFGVTLSTGSYDLSRFSGLRFTYETESALFVSVEAIDGQSKTYATTVAIPPTNTESVATVLFSSMNLDVGFAGFSKADAIRFALADKTSGFGVGIHRLELVP
jgi:hypothetical protein